MYIETQIILILAAICVAAVCIVAYYLVKLLTSLKELSQNLTQTTQILNTELEPTLKDVRETMHSINTIIQNTDQGMDNMKTGIEAALKKTKSISEGLFGGLVKGFLTVYSLMKKK